MLVSGRVYAFPCFLFFANLTFSGWAHLHNQEVRYWPLGHVFGCLKIGWAYQHDDDDDC